MLGKIISYLLIIGLMVPSSIRGQIFDLSLCAMSALNSVSRARNVDPVKVRRLNIMGRTLAVTFGPRWTAIMTMRPSKAMTFRLLFT